MRRGIRFTLLEIMIAVAILGVSLALILSIVGGARSRILRAEQTWARQHLLTQATEMFLLAGPDAEVLDGLFPGGFGARCAVSPVEDLPSQGREANSNWVLAQYQVSLTGRKGETIDQLTVEKLVPEVEP